MRKQQLMELKVGDKVISKKDNSISTVTGIADKVELDNNKQYSQSTMIRWYSIYEEPVDLVETTIIEEKHEDDQLHDDTEQTTKKDVISRDTATTNTLNGIVDLHRCKLEQMKEYIKVSREGVKRTLVYIRTPRGTGYHFDVSKKTWNKLTSEYQQYLIEQYGASIVDSSRGLWRIANCNELDVFEVLLLTALKIA